MQPELPFFTSDSGYSRWHEECACYRRDLERKLGVPLGVKVRVILRDFQHPFTGILELVVGTERAPRLRLSGLRFEFTLDEIVSIHRMDGEDQTISSTARETTDSPAAGH